MVCCRALALQLLPASAPSRAAAASRARVSVRRRRVLYARCCAAAGADHGESPQDAVLKAISQIASSNGRVAQTTNVVMGDTVTDDATDEWLVLDKKVNTYPTVRGFTAIGTGGDDFVQSMVVAVESILLERIPEDLMFHAFWYSMQVQKDLLFEFHNPKLDGRLLLFKDFPVSYIPNFTCRYCKYLHEERAIEVVSRILYVGIHIISLHPIDLQPLPTPCTEWAVEKKR